MGDSDPTFFSRVTSLRLVKFVLVGASGVPVNIVMLYCGKEYLFDHIHYKLYGFELSLNLALAFAIFCSIINNFAWNHHWTWGDRKYGQWRGNSLSRFGRYVVASWLGVAIQLVLTNALARLGLYYLIANLVAISVASIANFVLSDKWAFRVE